MPAGLPAYDLLNLLGKILIDPESHRLLQKRKGPGAFRVFHSVPAPLNGKDLQTGEAQVQVNLQTVNIVFQDPVDRQPVCTLPVNAGQFISSELQHWRVSVLFRII